MKRALLVLLIATAAIAQPWLDAYNRGVAAVQAEKYAAAVEALQAAIREAPTENAKYLPHMWLGIARANLKEPDAALAEFRISEEQGAVQKTQYYADLREWVAHAQKQKRRIAEDAIKRARSAQNDALFAGAEKRDDYRTAQQRLSEAMDVFERAGTDVRAYTHAGELAAQAQTMFVAAAQEAQKSKPAPGEVVVPFFDQTPPPKPQVKPPPPQPQVESESLVAARIAVQNYRRKLTEAKLPVAEATQFERQLAGNPDEKTIVRVVAQVAEHEHRLHPPAPVPAPAPEVPPPVDTHPDLEAAYRAFALGDLTASESLLTSAIAKSATAEAYALRGAARYTRAMLSRTPDALLPAAADDFRTALKINAALRLDDGAFSPKLVSFFEDVRKGK